MGPAEICKDRLEAQTRDLEHWKKRHRWLGNARLVGGVAGVAVLWFVETYAPAFTWYLVAALVAAFLATSRMFSRVEDAMTYAEHAARLYKTPVLGEKRKDGPSHSVEALNYDGDHPYARDVDIFEPGGLTDYLNISSTREGLLRLLELLTEPASSDTIAKRQEAVKELKSQLDLRESFFVAGSRRLPYVRTEVMRLWAEQKPVPVSSWLPVACLVASCAVLVAGAFVAFNPSPPTYSALAACLLAEFAVWKASRPQARAIQIMTAERIHLDFRELWDLVRILEEQDFHSSNLRERAGSLRGDGEPASRAIGRFCRVIGLFEARRNQIVALVGPLVLYQTQLALAMERWKRQHGSKVSGWIDAIGKFEAYSSLACFAFEHPFYSFPRVAVRGPVFKGTDIAHPLLPDDAVGNDVSLDPECPVLVVSGANMAGKSTLLRTIGVNVALAYAGAPVRASSLEISPVNLIASIRVNDSLKKGLSRFAAELVRIRFMLNSIGKGTSTLVLIDELFAGTNSFDRFVGAVALAEFLVGCDTSLAVLSTHDRNVTHWAEQNPERIANVHFQDVFKEDRMRFDYKLHDGPALRGNAIALMKLAGLPIPDKLPTPQG